MTEDSAPDLDPVTLAELQRLSRSRPKSGRGQLAKLGAIRTLERLRRAGKSTLPMPAGWHPLPGTKWDELDRAFLDEHPAARERWWAALHP
jgi:hypothetical protein